MRKECATTCDRGRQFSETNPLIRNVLRDLFSDLHTRNFYLKNRMALLGHKLLTIRSQHTLLFWTMTILEWKVKIASWGSIFHVLLLRDGINGGALATKYGHKL